MAWNPQDETVFRASRLCRVLGNPKTYEIVRRLVREGAAAPSELAHELGRSYSTVCIHLRHLRAIDVVRSWKERPGNRTLYDVTSPVVGALLSTLEGFTSPAVPHAVTGSPGPVKKGGGRKKKGGGASRSASGGTKRKAGGRAKKKKAARKGKRG